MYYVLSLAGLGGIWVISKPSAFLNFCWLNMLAPTSGAVMLVHSNPVDPCVQDYGVEIFHALLSVVNN